MTTILGLTLHLNDAEINIAVRTILCPTDNLTSRGTRKIQIVQNLIQEEMTTGLKLVVCKCLLCLKEHAVVIGIGFVVAALTVEIYSIIALEIRVGDHHSLLDLLLLSGLGINFDFLELLCLNTILEFGIDLLAETLDNSTTILLEALIDCSISSTKSHIAFTQNIVRCQNTGDGQSAKNNGRTIKLCELHSGLSIDLNRVLLAIIVRILMTIDCTGLHSIMDDIESTLSFIENLCYLSGGLASENGTYDRTGNTSHNENLGAVLLELHNGLGSHAVHALHNFSFIFHGLLFSFSVFRVDFSTTGSVSSQIDIAVVRSRSCPDSCDLKKRHHHGNIICGKFNAFIDAPEACNSSEVIFRRAVFVLSLPTYASLCFIESLRSGHHLHPPHL
nr:MAG TPA: hypothetical protein [Caudoviricetes sp.]